MMDQESFCHALDRSWLDDLALKATQRCLSLFSLRAEGKGGMHRLTNFLQNRAHVDLTKLGGEWGWSSRVRHVLQNTS